MSKQPTAPMLFTLDTEQLKELMRSVIREERLAQDPEKEILTLTEAAELLGRHPKTIRRLIKSEKLPHHPVGRHPKFKRSEIMDWISSREPKKEPA